MGLIPPVKIKFLDPIIEQFQKIMAGWNRVGWVAEPIEIMDGGGFETLIDLEL